MIKHDCKHFAQSTMQVRTYIPFPMDYFCIFFSKDLVARKALPYHWLSGREFKEVRRTATEMAIIFYLELCTCVFCKWVDIIQNTENFVYIKMYTYNGHSVRWRLQISKGSIVIFCRNFFKTSFQHFYIASIQDMTFLNMLLFSI